MAYKPSLKRKAPDETVEPNITPIMNLMVVLIPVLLSMAQFIQLALLEYMPPPIEAVSSDDSEGGSDNSGGGEGPALIDLLLNVSIDGFEVSMFGDTQGENFIVIPRTPRMIGGQPLIDPNTGQPVLEYNYSALHDTLVWVRQEKIGQPIHEEDAVDPETGLTVRREVFRYEDAQKIKIASRGDTPWQVMVHVLDQIREFEEASDITGSDGSPIMVSKPLFPSPQLGQIQ